MPSNNREYHTKRIRKARRQGLAPSKEVGRRGTKANLREPGMAGRDNPAEFRPNARRTSLTTGRKSKRQERSLQAKPRRMARAT